MAPRNRRRPRPPETDAGQRTQPNPKWLLTLGLVAVLLVRVYYLVLTRHQPVWWDESEYLVKAKALALGTPDTGWFTGRPLLPSLLIAGAYAIGLGELAVRVGLALLSTATVYLTYRLGLRLAGRPAALVGAGLFSVFYLQLFYSTRVMTEIPHLALCLLATELFLSGERRKVLLSVPVIVVATLLRFPAALTLVTLASYDAVAA